MKGAGGDGSYVLDGVEHYGVQADFSDNEKVFIFDLESSDHIKLQYSWRVKAAHALLWSVGLVEDLSFPTHPCDWNAFWNLFHNTCRGDFLQSMELRPQSAILDETDLIYRLPWAVREALLSNSKMPAGLDPSVVIERHHALNWLAAPADEPFNWDDTPTDTSAPYHIARGTAGIVF